MVLIGSAEAGPLNVHTPPDSHSMAPPLPLGDSWCSDKFSFPSHLNFSEKKSELHFGESLSHYVTLLTSIAF